MAENEELAKTPTYDRDKVLSGLTDCAERGLDLLHAAIELDITMIDLTNLMIEDEEARKAYDRGLMNKHLYFLRRMEEEEQTDSRTSFAARRWLLDYYEKRHKTVAAFTPIPQLSGKADANNIQIIDPSEISEVRAILQDYKSRQPVETYDIDPDDSEE